MTVAAVAGVTLFAAPAALAHPSASHKRHKTPVSKKKHKASSGRKQHHKPTSKLPVPQHKLGRGTSTNWAGYAISATGATHVIGTWTQPSVTCAPGENSWSSPWIGIDGDTSNTVEQIGTDSDCKRGAPTYYAWYEMYPKSLVTLALPVHAGDSITGEVTYRGSGFLLKLTNNTTGATFQTTQSSKRAKRNSVEWIMEGPASGILSDFGSISFESASATVGGRTGSIGAFANDPITMVSNQGVTRAQPSPLWVGGSAFSVAWQHA